MYYQLKPTLLLKLILETHRGGFSWIKSITMNLRVYFTFNQILKESGMDPDEFEAMVGGVISSNVNN